jgi:pilus assembly protein CpaC
MLRRRSFVLRARGVIAATLCAASFLSGELLFGQQPAGAQAPVPAPAKPSWVFLPSSLTGSKSETTPESEASLAKKSQQTLKRVSVGVAPSDGSEVPPANAESSLPPILSAKDMPRPSRNRPAGPMSQAFSQPGQTTPGNLPLPLGRAPQSGTPTIVANPALPRPVEAKSLPLDQPLPAGKPVASSPWMQDIRSLIGTTPGPKNGVANNPAKNETKQVQYEGNGPAPALAPAAELPLDLNRAPTALLPLPQPPAEGPEPTPAPFGAPLAEVPLAEVAAQPGFNQAPRIAPQPVNLLTQPGPVAPSNAPPLAPTPGQKPLDPRDDAMQKAGSPFQVIDESGAVQVMVRRSKLLRTKVDIYRTAVVDDSICDIVQFTPREVSIIGKAQGSTHVTFWFDDPAMQPITYLIQVVPDVAALVQQESTYKMLQDVINEMFPDSKIQLLVVADKLIIRGQAKDSEEAAQIVALIRSQTGGYSPGNGAGGWGGGFSEGAAAQVLNDSATGAAQRSRLQVINMLRVPGVQQVALRVKIAEMNRSAARGFGVDLKGNINFTDNPDGSQLFLNSLLSTAAGAGPALLTQVDGDDIQIGVRYLQSHGVLRLLSEPTLVTMSGTPATFIAGGEFAVPTLVGSAGLNAVTTDFRAFGAIISFMPTVVDKDRIRLQVSPEFSQINSALTVNNTPGLRVRAATTTVEMREGQTLAIAGLLEDNMNGTNVGDVPFLAKIFGRRDMSRNETELLILVTPELVHAMEAEEVPPLPGFDITEPTSAQFFLGGRLEGNPTQDYRSTVWPRLKKRYGAGGPAMTSGPFGHGQ